MMTEEERVAVRRAALREAAHVAAKFDNGGGDADPLHRIPYMITIAIRALADQRT